MVDPTVAAGDAPAQTWDTSLRRRSPLPRWPFTALFVGFPVWWLLGFVDVAWILAAGAMTWYLASSGRVRVPRGFGWWLLFLLWAGASALMLGGGLGFLGFGYRYAIYLAAGVIAVYVYNARATLTSRLVTGCLTAWWITTVVGGYLGLLMPSAVLRTPTSYLLSPDLLANELVNHMVVRRFAQYNPDSFLEVDPRPSAPFLYTNNWGNVYSLLLPFVLAYMFQVRGTKRFWFLVLALPVSAVPALLTLNRGMFIGIGIAALYAVVKLISLRRFGAVGAIAAAFAIGVVLFQALPVAERLDNRLDTSADATSNDTRASLYVQAIDLVPGSPVLGYGVPQDGANSNAAPVGTQGQVWMLLVSHGPIATLCYLSWFVVAFFRCWRRRDPVGLACQTTLVVGTVELFYYGMVPNGLPLMMVAAALGLRGVDRPTAAPAPRPREMVAAS
jgi:polysaccharide biosynthesis protein PslJ